MKLRIRPLSDAERAEWLADIAIQLKSGFINATIAKIRTEQVKAMPRK